jgi:lipopolysaccharide export system protein LptA
MGTQTLKHVRISMWLVLALFVFPGPGAFAAAVKAKAPEAEFPLHITAARLEADQKEGVIVFTGKVKAEYGDSTLYADQLRVYFKPQPKTGKSAAPAAATEQQNSSPLAELGGQKLDRIVAQGQVRFVQEDRVATGQEAIYYKDREEVVLRGNPQLWRAENTLKGERIIFNIKTNRVVVESSPQKRVEALLYSQGPGAGKETLQLGPKTRRGKRP